MKGKIKKSLIIFICCFFGVVCSYILNYYFLDKIFIPDPCAYHIKETSTIFDFFYTIKSSEGYHPSPSNFNFVITSIIGVLIGFKIYKLIVNTEFKKAQSSKPEAQS
jgi:hypothetical protein